MAVRMVMLQLPLHRLEHNPVHHKHIQVVQSLIMGAKEDEALNLVEAAAAAVEQPQEQLAQVQLELTIKILPVDLEKEEMESQTMF